MYTHMYGQLINATALTVQVGSFSVEMVKTEAHISDYFSLLCKYVGYNFGTRKVILKNSFRHFDQSRFLAFKLSL